MNVSKNIYDGDSQLFIEVQEGCKVSCLKKYWHFVNLLGGQYLFEILHTSPTVKASQNVLRSGCFLRLLWWECSCFCELKEGYKFSCIKTIF